MVGDVLSDVKGGVGLRHLPASLPFRLREPRFVCFVSRPTTNVLTLRDCRMYENVPTFHSALPWDQFAVGDILSDVRGCMGSR